MKVCKEKHPPKFRMLYLKFVLLDWSTVYSGLFISAKARQVLKTTHGMAGHKCNITVITENISQEWCKTHKETANEADICLFGFYNDNQESTEKKICCKMSFSSEWRTKPRSQENSRRIASALRRRARLDFNWIAAIDETLISGFEPELKFQFLQ